MDPNQQPQDFNKQNETAQEFGAPQQPEFSQPASTPTPASESSTTPEPSMQSVEVEPTSDEAPTESQGFGQPAETNQQPVPQPAFPATEATPADQAPAHTGENPGQVLGIVSIVLSFLGLSLVGIILGVISRKKSKAAGASTTLGTIGMVIGIIFLTLSILFSLLILVPLIILGASGKLDAKTNNSDLSSLSDQNSSASTLATDATTVATKAEAYKAIAGDYPKTSSDFDKYPQSTVDSDTFFFTMLVTDSEVTYFYCNPGAAQVVYYEDSDRTKLNITALGTASSTESCKN